MLQRVCCNPIVLELTTPTQQRSDVFPQPGFLNSATLLTQPWCTVSRHGELKFILLPSSTCEITAGMRKDPLYRGSAFPCIERRSFTGLFIAHCPQLLNLWVLLFWATDLIRQLTVIRHDPLHQRQAGAGLMIVSLPSASSTTDFVCPHVGQLCSREIPLLGYLHFCI